VADDVGGAYRTAEQRGEPSPLVAAKRFRYRRTTAGGAGRRSCLIDDWSRTRRAPRHAAWLHAGEFERVAGE
jgi:ribosomal protein L35